MSLMNIFVFVGNKANRTIWTFSEEGFENFLHQHPEDEYIFADADTPYTNHELNLWLSQSPEGTKRMLVVKGDVIAPTKLTQTVVKVHYDLANPVYPLRED